MDAAEFDGIRPPVVVLPLHNDPRLPPELGVLLNDDNRAQAGDAALSRPAIELPNGDLLDVSSYEEWDRVPASNAPRLRAAVHPRGMQISTLTYANGSVLGRIGHNGTKLQGECEILHPNGQKMLSGTYSEGDRKGNFTVWDSNGILRLHSHRGRHGYLNHYGVYCDDRGDVLMIAR